jgi:hypothetical protein
MGVRSLLVATVALFGVACGSRAAAGDATAIDACAAADLTTVVHGTVTSVAGGFSLPASDVADWQETRYGAAGPRLSSPLRALPPTTPLTVCYIDGTFPGYPRPPSDATAAASSRPYDRIVVELEPKPTVDIVGYREQTPVKRPGKNVLVNP